MVGGVVALARHVGVPVLVVAGRSGPAGSRALSPGRGAEVVVRTLTDRFGEDRALGDPAGCAEEVVADAVGELFGTGRR